MIHLPGLASLNKPLVLRPIVDCFQCFLPQHLANARKEKVKFSICASRRHQDLLHLSSAERKTSSKRRRGPQTLSQTFTQSARQPFAKMFRKGILEEKYCWLISSGKRRFKEFTQLRTIRATLRLFPPSYPTG